uniref:Uncharacterized protein n=1 Tax=Cajanus cajan TaxID=3821 RepID=A0A151QVR3_CAJCA|nr:hypothetical protein KK1_044779 [Cajanus cajan]
MRFLLEFVACCGSPVQGESKPVLTRPPEEETSLVSATPSAVLIRRSYRKKQRMGSAEWRPSLRPISEDSPRERESPRTSSASSTGRDAKRRSPGGGGGKVRLRSYSDSNYGSVNVIAFLAV